MHTSSLSLCRRWSISHRVQIHPKTQRWKPSLWCAPFECAKIQLSEERFSQRERAQVTPLRRRQIRITPHHTPEFSIGLADSFAGFSVCHAEKILTSIKRAL